MQPLFKLTRVRQGYLLSVGWISQFFVLRRIDHRGTRTMSESVYNHCWIWCNPARAPAAEETAAMAVAAEVPGLWKGHGRVGGGATGARWRRAPVARALSGHSAGAGSDATPTRFHRTGVLSAQCVRHGERCCHMLTAIHHNQPRPIHSVEAAARRGGVAAACTRTTCHQCPISASLRGKCTCLATLLSRRDPDMQLPDAQA